MIKNKFLAKIYGTAIVAAFAMSALKRTTTVAAIDRTSRRVRKVLR